MVLLHDLARGILEPGTYHLFGQGGTGKTTIAACCAAGVAGRGKAVAWIDASAGFSAPRFAEISMAVAGKDLSGRVLLNKVATPLALDHAIGLLRDRLAGWHAGLVVLDTAFGVIDRAPDDPALARVLWIQAKEQLARLVLLCNALHVPLLLVNNVGYKPGAGQERPTGEAIVRSFRPEAAMTRHVIGPGGKTGRVSYLSCDDETTFAVVPGGVAVRAARVPPGRRGEGGDAGDTGDDGEEVARA